LIDQKILEHESHRGVEEEQENRRPQWSVAYSLLIYCSNAPLLYFCCAKIDEEQENR
jgi:hypothetical protein